MEHRVTALETRLDSILPTLATREDMHKIDSSIKGWMIATIISLFLGFAGLFFTVSNSLHQPSPPQVVQAPAAPNVTIQLPQSAVEAMYRNAAPAHATSTRPPPLQ